jgi:protein disulfide-isomerase A6
LAAVNIKKGKFSILRGSFSKDGINGKQTIFQIVSKFNFLNNFSEFLRDLSYGKGSILPLKGTGLPKINTITPWDGKDAELIPEEDIDLSDVELDDIKEEL